MFLKWMALPIAILAFMGVVLPASAQTVALSYTGSGSSVSNGNGITGTGTGTMAGGAASVTLTGLASNGGACDSSLQMSIKGTAANGTDSLTTFLEIPSGASGSGSGTLNLSGTLTVTAGTGIYAGKGGSGTATISVTLTKTGSGQETFTYTFVGSVALGGTVATFATVNPGGVVPVNSDLAYVQSDSWVSIYGSSLANATALWTGNFPTSLGNVTVTFDGKPGFLWFVSAGQINVQVPDDSKTGCIPVVVNTPNGTVNSTVDLEPIAPSLNVITGTNGKSYAAAVILTPNGTGAYDGGAYDIMGPTGNFPYSTRPAHVGDVVELFGVGFGPLKTAVPAGQLYSGASATTNAVQVSLNTGPTSGVQIPVNFSGLVGAGLYQITVTIPQGAPTGDSPMQIFVGNATNGSNSNEAQTSGDLTVYMSIQ